MGKENYTSPQDNSSDPVYRQDSHDSSYIRDTYLFIMASSYYLRNFTKQVVQRHIPSDTSCAEQLNKTSKRILHGPPGNGNPTNSGYSDCTENTREGRYGWRILAKDWEKSAEDHPTEF
jgi:hypothetical protein